jgi:sigma-B regulation protein RsbU (phosphoserine phosphatase)
MPEARLEVTDAVGRRVVLLDRHPFTIGRRETNDLRLVGGEVSRTHAEIVLDDGAYVLRDRQSRYGTFVNDRPVAEHRLVHGDRIRLGRSGGAELVFLLEDARSADERLTTTAIGDVRHVAALLEGLRALGSGRVLDEVLALVLDSAIEVGAAERGFIMLAGPSGQLEFKLARARGRGTLPAGGIATSRKIPEEVFRTGETRVVADLLDGDLARAHLGTVQLGIRHVLCVPLRLVRYVDGRAGAADEEKRIGVLYLDSRERGTFASASTRAALETLATEAAVAIEHARLYREALEKARLDEELRIAAAIQRAILPTGRHRGAFCQAAAGTLPCRAIGGDFYEYFDLPDGRFAFALGDVAGKGPAAALLSALVQGILAARADPPLGPAATLAAVNAALVRRAVEARFVTLFYGILDADGRLVSSSAGHIPPIVLARDGVRRLTRGGPPLGLFDGAPYVDETVPLEAGDALVVFSDGVSEAFDPDGLEFGDARVVDCASTRRGAPPADLLAALFARVEAHAAGAPQHDDVTALVVRYEGRR